MAIEKKEEFFGPSKSFICWELAAGSTLRVKKVAAPNHIAALKRPTNLNKPITQAQYGKVQVVPSLD